MATLLESRTIARLVLALTVLFGAHVGAQWTDVTDLTNPPTVPRLAPGIKAVPALVEASRAARNAGGVEVAKNALRSLGMPIDDAGLAAVEIVGNGSGGEVDVAELVGRHGGSVVRSWGDRTEARVPVAEIETLSTELPVGFMVEPRGFGQELPSFDGNAMAVMNTTDYRDDGFDGTGITIGIVDSGFFGLIDSRLSGDAPGLFDAGFEKIDLTGAGFESSSVGTHGRFVMETIYDHAPNATYKLFNTQGQTQVAQAISDLTDMGVDIISMSIGYWTPWEDDTASVTQAANAAADAGILFFNSCGNEADEHWQGFFDDGNDSDGYHAWNGSNDEALGILCPPSGTVSFRLTMDPAGGDHDYDLFLYDQTATQVLASSTLSGESSESVSFTNPFNNVSVQLQLVVKRIAGPGTEFEIFSSGGTWQQFSKRYGSNLSPSDSSHPLVISVGAAERSLYGSSKYDCCVIASYSSGGPTNGGTPCPDICAPTSTSTSFASSFIGTSAACPNAAGLAASLWSVNPLASAAQVRDLIFQWAHEKDWGAVGFDNTYGHGGVHYPPYADCNSDDWPDAFDIASGGSDDDNHNGIPDECENPGYGFDLRGPLLPPSFGFDLVAAIDPTPDPTGPLSPVTGFKMATTFDPSTVVIDDVALAPALAAALAGAPYDLQVLDLGGALVIECTFGNDPATGAPISLPLDVRLEAVVIGCTPVPPSVPGTDGEILFVVEDVPGTSAVNEIYVAGSTVPVTPSTLAATSVQTVVVPGHRYSISPTATVEDELFIEYDPASPSSETFTLLWRVARYVEASLPTSGVSMALRHDAGDVAALGAVSAMPFDMDPELFLVQIGADGVAIDATWSTAGTLDQEFPLSGMTVAEIAYATNVAPLAGNTDGALVAIGFDDTIAIAGAQNTVFGPGLSETPPLQGTLVHLVPSANPEPQFRRGDLDGNGSDIADAIQMLGYLFQGGAQPGCLDAADVNDDGAVNLGDPIALLGYLFQGSAPPPAPGPTTCGVDPTSDTLDCNDSGC
ncbi:MAG: S8 family serine peptidase [Planctomycetes bacterium]|nr:S8 family serine peptidase [Planctomycetota bacterium]